MGDRDLIILICAGVIGLAAVIRASAYIVRGVVSVVHKVDQINKVTQRELTPNDDGESIKSDVHGMAVSIGKLQQVQEHERDRLNAALRIAAEHHPESAALYLALRRERERR